jgi:hypothetical protein
MTFLTPLFLLAGLAVVGPVLFHLIRQSRKDRLRFSSLLFLEPSPPRLTERRRLEHWLLLLLRILALALLALAFARPFWKQLEETIPPVAAERATVLLDNSPSMKRQGLEAKAQAVAEKLGAEIVTFETNLAEALTKAVSRQESGVLHLVTDAQEGCGLEKLAGFAWPPDFQLRLHVVTPETQGNAGIQLAARNQPVAESGVRIRITNSADALAEQFSLRWRQADAPPLECHVAKGQQTVVTLPWPQGKPQQGLVELRGDSEAFDNTLAVSPPQAIQAQVLHFSAKEDFFLKNALGPNAVLLHNPTAPDFANAALAVVDDPKAWELVQGKISTFVCLTDASLARELGLSGISEAGNTGDLLLGNIDFTHPLFQPFADPKYNDFTRIRFQRVSKADLPPNARILAKFDNGLPALWELPEQKLTVLMSSWASTHSQLALSSKFPALLGSLLANTPAAQAIPQQVLGTAPGFTDVKHLGQTFQVPVNLDPNESRTTPLALEDFERYGLPLKPTTLPSTAKSGLAGASEVEGRQKLWKWLMLACLGVLLVESLVLQKRPTLAAP